MDRLLTTFIHALRNADVRISTAETLDALKAVDLVGYRDRALLKNSLALVLPKTQDEKAAFDTCFDRFFASRDTGSFQPPDSSASPQHPSDAAPGQPGNSEAGGGGEQTSAAENRREASATSESSAADADEAAFESGEPSTPQSALGQLLTRANQMEISTAVHCASRRVNVHEIQVFTQKGVYTRRVMEAMGLEDLQQEIARLGAGAAISERRLGHELSRRRDWLRERVRDYVERQFLLHADVKGRRLREDLLRDVRLGALDARHRRLAQDLILRMARRLAAAYSRRKKVFDRGSLHVPRTLRRNMKYDDAIFDLHWKSVKVDRPKVFAICDLSGSVASYASFMLMFLYSLGAVLPKVRSFAFSCHLAEVSDLFARHGIDDAMALALKQYGGGSTDYGQAFADFRRLCRDDIDRRTTLIILGDARNNYGDNGMDALKELYERSGRVIWLNPEARAIWNTGDSEMRHYAVYCHQVEQCGTLAQLERVVSRLLRS